MNEIVLECREDSFPRTLKVPDGDAAWAKVNNLLDADGEFSEQYEKFAFLGHGTDDMRQIEKSRRRVQNDWKNFRGWVITGAFGEGTLPKDWSKKNIAFPTKMLFFTPNVFPFPNSNCVITN